MEVGLTQLLFEKEWDKKTSAIARTALIALRRVRCDFICQ